MSVDQNPLLDKDVEARHVLDLAGADAVAGFFAWLGYNTEARLEQKPENLGITADGTVRPIRRVERIAEQDGLLEVYLFEVKSLTRGHTVALARTMKNLSGEFLLVLTADYERIDFVLLHSYLPLKAGSGSGIGQRQVKVRPRVLSVNRRNPERVDLRVLRRFTYTESDPILQFDKLKSAYDLLEWSEEHFNNRALFSDYYLTERLKEYPEWNEDVKPAFRDMRELYAGAPQRFVLDLKPEDSARKSIREGLIVPSLERLGFRLKAKKPEGKTSNREDFLLLPKTLPLAKGEPEGVESRTPQQTDNLPQPLLGKEGSQNASSLPLAKGEPEGVCVFYPWSRSLDGPDDERDTETKNEVPASVVVRLLESGTAPWVILTNGKLWRLYSQRAHSKATNYYEIDLEETLAEGGQFAADIGESFRFFWLLFRSEAFIPREVQQDGKTVRASFLDQLLTESVSYARELGERLKGRVFEEVFPHLAAGFIEAMREEDPEREFAPAGLSMVFQGTLTFLYRLLFLLYAEARDLLPVRETRGYYEASLKRMKKEIAEAGGNIEEEKEARLRKRYTGDSEVLYRRLLRLFEAVDKGDQELNVPVYNGGLFITDSAKDDGTPEAEHARFLNRYRLKDRYLALAIDLLAREVDPKRQDLVPVDYKSLGVRQLGSIYEGLLEFRVEIAPEKMAVVKGKKAEEIVPYREAKKKELKVLTRGRGSEREERVYKKGEVYIVNDKRERKASGSYYTPDHIVEYIVENAVGPVLREKFEAMRPRLREAQQRRKAFDEKQEALKQKGLKSEPAEKAETIGQELVPDFFDLKVLDPAMGSGHFLVEAVDFITNKALEFLDGFPNNPILAYLNRMKAVIVMEMERQGVDVDVRKLTPENLLKRHVLKRCIYGVDLNPMAVELAKVSLWLDCFTLGAPLSFLDHHLRCGNSLIGVTVPEYEKASKEREEREETRLWGAPPINLLQAVQSMLEVGRLSDVTSAQVHESRSSYRRALDVLAPLKRRLDVFTSRWFSNPPRKAKKGRMTEEISPVLDFLVDPVSENWSRAPEKDHALGPFQTLVDNALQDARYHRFFHWELEFPEVFYGPRPGTKQAVERLEQAGFDAVVGNPPYVRQEGLRDEKPFFQSLHSPVYSGIADLYVYFYHRGVTLCRRGGLFGMITANKFLRSGYGENLRGFLSRLAVRELIDFGDLPIFPDASAYPMIAIIENAPAAEKHRTRGYTVPDMTEAEGIRDGMSRIPPGLSLLSVGSGTWTIQDAATMRLMEKIREAGTPLGEYVNGRFYRGILTGLNEAFVVDRATRDRLIAEHHSSAEVLKPFLRGRDVKRWRVEPKDIWLIFTRRGIDIKKYPAILEHLQQYEMQLRPGVPGGRKPGSYEWYEIQDNIAYWQEFERAKILYPDIYEHQSFTWDSQGYFSANTCYFIPTDEIWLTALLNSLTIEWFYSKVSNRVRGGYLRAFSDYVRQIPIPKVTAKDRKELGNIVSRILTEKDEDNIVDLEQEIDDRVYALFGLTNEEIIIIQGAI